MDKELAKDFSPVSEEETDVPQAEESTGSFLSKKKILVFIIIFLAFVGGLFFLINFNLQAGEEENIPGTKNTNVNPPKLEPLILPSLQGDPPESHSRPNASEQDRQIVERPTNWEYRVAPNQAPSSVISRAVDPVRVQTPASTYDQQTAYLQQKLAEENAARSAGGRISVNSQSTRTPAHENHPMPQMRQSNPAAYINQTATENGYFGDAETFYQAGKNEDAVYGVLPAYDLSYCLQPGTVIEAVLLTDINSDLPGNIVAMVTSNVYDSHSQRNLLIPQGTKMIARYNASVSYGQNRIQIAWSDLYRPDGITVELGNMPGVDSTGATGYRGRVNNHGWEVLKGLGVLAAFSVLDFELAYNAAALNSPGAVNLASDMQKAASTVGEGYVGRALDIQPTITVKSGLEIKVFVDTPIILPPFTWEL